VRAVVVGPLSSAGLKAVLPATDVRIDFNLASGEQGSGFTPFLEPGPSIYAQQPPYLNVNVREPSSAQVSSLVFRVVWGAKNSVRAPRNERFTGRTPILAPHRPRSGRPSRNSVSVSSTSVKRDSGASSLAFSLCPIFSITAGSAARPVGLIKSILLYVPQISGVQEFV
jgi:hypothetical protein